MEENKNATEKTGEEQGRKYRQAEADLFASWKQKLPMGSMNHGENVWIADGVLCPETWFLQPVRPLFLLKEAYGGQQDWDLRQLLLEGEGRNGHLPKVWQRVSSWAKGLLETTAEHLAPYAPEECCKRPGNEYLRQCAVMNLKKSGGRPQSDWKELEAYVAYDGEELRKQLRLIRPTVVVCGNTGRFLCALLNQWPPKNPHWFFSLSLDGQPFLVLDYYHPANQFPDLLNYYGLMGCYQQALQDRERKKASPAFEAGGL